jgi:hypothetical protein
MNKTLVHSLRIVELKAFKQGPHKRGASVTRLIVLRFLYTSISLLIFGASAYRASMSHNRGFCEWLGHAKTGRSMHTRFRQS